MREDLMNVTKHNTGFMAWWKLLNEVLDAEKWGHAGLMDARNAYERGGNPEEEAEVLIAEWRGQEAADHDPRSEGPYIEEVNAAPAAKAAADEVPRDYRNDIDVDEQLDIIRTAPRKEARELYRTTLDVAYHQGRVEATGETVRRCARLMTDATAELVLQALGMSEPTKEGE